METRLALAHTNTLPYCPSTETHLTTTDIIGVVCAAYRKVISIKHIQGVCVYVRSDIGFNQRMDLNNDQIEAVWLNILLPKSKPILVGACYRPPDQTMFYEILDEVCSKCTDFVNSEVIMIGDFNTDIRKTDLSGYKGLMNFCRSFSLHQLIKEPTRVCSSTQTIIDLVLVSDKSRIADSGVRNYGLSDHSIVFCTRKIKKAVLNCHRSIRIRSLKRYSKEAFDDCLNLKNWSAVLQCNDVDKACFIFKCMFLEAVDNLAPFKVVRVKQRTEPWINDDILEAIRLRNKKYGIFRRNKDDQSWAEYKKVRNEVNRLVVNAKKAYFNEKIVEYRNDSGKLWNSLKQLGYSSRLKTKTSNITLDLGNNVTAEKVTVADSFNNYFSSVASKLVEKLPDPSGQYGESQFVEFYSQQEVKVNGFSFEKVSEAVVLEKLKNLNSSKATGLDNIPARFLRDAAEVITPCITHIINMSIEQGYCPNDFKFARVIPLYKKGSKLEHGNYRPVSILCSLSKIIEKIIFEQIDKYLASHNLLYEFQSGFRKSHSTDTCVLYLTDHIRREVDKGYFCGMVMLDLQKAFDTVDHGILICKLKAIGFNDLAVNWVSSYLRDRKQVVDIGGTMSQPQCIECGVPQGSVLGPLFFLIYIYIYIYK